VVEVRIEGKRLDVFEGFDFSFNYGVADIRNPEKRSTEYSKTIKCPSTKSNDALFGHIYDVNISNPYDANTTNIDVNFNPNKKAEARVIADGVEVMAGVVQLRKVTQKGHAYTYEVVFVGKLLNIFSVLGDKELNGLDDDGFPHIDFSDLDHQYDYGRITSSWNNTSGYVYPMLDYGVVEPFQSNGANAWQVEQFRPAVFLYNIIDRVFSFADFTYNSSFFDSVLFKKLIVPWTNQGFVIGDAEIASRACTAKGNFTNLSDEFAPNFPAPPLNGSATIGFDGFVDPNNLWSNTGDYYEAFVSGFYNASVTVSFTATRYAGSSVIGDWPTSWGIRILRVDGSISWAQSSSITIDLPSGSTPSITTESVGAEDIWLGAGDRIYASINSSPSMGFILAEHTITTDNTSTFVVEAGDLGIVQGQSIPMNALVPNISMKDMLLSIFKMFNLYIEVDPENERNLLIETRDDFYKAGGTKDWTYKLAREKDINIEPLGVLTDKLYTYTYKSDEDYDNAKYESKYSRVYGDSRIEVDNDFIKSDKKVEIEFSPTVLVNDRDSNRIVGRIYNEDIEDGAQQTEHNIRVLYWGGLLPSSPSWIFRYRQSQTDIDVLQNHYPYAGHWDNPLTPTLDINFGVTRELRYQTNANTGTLQITNANLFNIYHRNYFLDITDKDNKVMTALFYLEPTDINTLDFRDQIVIDNAYWRLNKVMNYNPFKEGLTKVELIKIKEPVTFSKSDYKLGKTAKIEDSLGKVRAPNVGNLKRSNNTFPDFAGSVRGKNNRVGAGSSKFVINGDYNFIGNGSTNINISGDNNEVFGGLHNVQLINTNSVTITESNTTFINGKQQENRDVLDGGENTVRALNGGTNIFTVDGGKDIVQTQFSDSAIYLIEGGID
jgi:hypothetical protein